MTMRKALIFLLVLALAALGFTIAAGVTVDRLHDDVFIREETVFGDPSWAKGLEVKTRAEQDSRLFWDTTYMACGDPRPTTEFTYSDQRLYEEGVYDGQFYLTMGGINYGTNMTMEEMDQAVDPYSEYFDFYSPSMLDIARDVAKDVKDGETVEKTVLVKDYYEYFPLGFSFDPINAPYDGGNGVDASLWKFFNRMFPIPVPEDLRVNVTVRREGEVYYVDMFVPDEDVEMFYEIYNLYTSSVVLEDGVFYGLFGGLDFSQAEAGYGIYYTPIVETDRTVIHQSSNGVREERSFVLLRQEVQNIMPMDPADSEAGALYASEDKNQVYALTKEGGQVYLTVFDSHTREIVQREETSMEIVPSAWIQDGVVLFLEQNWDEEEFTFHVYLNEKGKLVKWLETPAYLDNENGPYWYMEAQLAFDGQRLAIAQYMDHYDRSDHRIQVYDQNGLQYVGDYRHSGDDLPNHLRTWDGGLQIDWK